MIGTGYSYLQDYLPHVAQAVIRAGWIDSVGLGRMVLAYPELLWDVLQGRPCPTRERFYRLRTAGLLSGDSDGEARLRCELYARYLGRHLL